jgi:hypothetical protein
VANVLTSSTPIPESDLSYKSRKRLKPEEWDALALDVRNTVEAALGDRAPLEENLDEWNDMYEMVTEEATWPFEGAANIFVPLIPTQLESLLAYIAGKALVPRFYLVNGLTEEACKSAARVERYYNAELRRQRGETTWYQQILRWLHLSLRDGTAFMECVWKYRKSKVKVKRKQLKTQDDPDTGMPLPVLDQENGQPIFEDVETEIEDIYNDVDIRPVSLRNLITVPAAATSIHSAVAVIKVEYLYEDELKELARGIKESGEGEFSDEMVEMALSYTPTGNSELPSSQQPTGQYEDGRQVGLGNAQGTQVSKFFANRGPVEIYRVHTRQHDLDRDGTPEENIIWVHASSWRMIGWMRYNYFTNLGGAVSAVRPFFPFAPFERPGTLLGFSIPGRLSGSQNEMNAQRNMRLNEGTIRIQPPWWKNRNANIEDDNFSWGPNQTIESDSFEDVRRYELPQLPQQAYIDEQTIKQDAHEYTGLSSMMVGQQSSSRRSATEMRQVAAATSVRLDMIVMNFRFANRTLVNFIHALKRQFLNTDQQFTINGHNFKLTPEEINQDYLIDISGAADPMDAGTRRQEELAAYEIFMKDPDIAGNPMRRFALRRKLAETFNWADVDDIIGTEAEVQEQMRAMQAQAMLQHLQQTGQSLGAGAPGGGQPGGRPPGAGPPQQTQGAGQGPPAQGVNPPQQ